MKRGGYRSDRQRRAMFANMALKQGPLKISRFPAFSSSNVFSPDDQAFLDSLPEVIEVGNYIDMGSNGIVHELAGNPDFVVKFSSGRPSRTEAEWKKYQEFNLEKSTVIVPTALKYVNWHGNKLPALVRPKLTVIPDDVPVPNTTKKLFSNEQLEKMRQDLIQLSKRGIYFRDYFQVGIDKHGKAYIYDLDAVQEADKNSNFNAMAENDYLWQIFLSSIDKEKEFPKLDAEIKIEEFRKAYSDIEKEKDVSLKLSLIPDFEMKWYYSVPEFKLYYEAKKIPMPKEIKEFIESMEGRQ